MDKSSITKEKQIKTIYQKRKYNFPLPICALYFIAILATAISWNSFLNAHYDFSQIDLCYTILILFSPFLLFTIIKDIKKRILHQRISLVFYQNGLYIEEDMDYRTPPEYISWENIQTIKFNVDRRYIKIKAKKTSKLINNNDIMTIYTNTLDCPTDELLSYFPEKKIQYIRIPEDLAKRQFIYTYKIIFLCILLLLELFLLHKNCPNLILNIDALPEELKIIIVLIMIAFLSGINFAILCLLRKILFLQKRNPLPYLGTQNRNYYAEIKKIKTPNLL